MSIANCSQVQQHDNTVIINPADHVSSEPLLRSPEQELTRLSILINQLHPIIQLRGGHGWGNRLPVEIWHYILEMLLCHDFALKPTSNQNGVLVLLLENGSQTFDVALLRRLRGVSHSMRDAVVRIFFSKNTFYFEPGSEREIHAAWQWISALSPGMNQAGMEHLTHITITLDLASGLNRCRLDSTAWLLEYVQKIRSLEQLTIVIDGSEMKGKNWYGQHKRVFTVLAKLSKVRRWIVRFIPASQEMEARLAKAKEDLADELDKAKQAATSDANKDNSSGSGTKRKPLKIDKGKAKKKRN
jgi:hypothetical protein